LCGIERVIYTQKRQIQSVDYVAKKCEVLAVSKWPLCVQKMTGFSGWLCEIEKKQKNEASKTKRY